jgi:hypothetical protein
MLILRSSEAYHYSTSPEIETLKKIGYTDTCSGEFYIPADSKLTIVTFYTSPDNKDGTPLYVKRNNVDNEPFTFKVKPGSSYEFPGELRGAKYIAIAGDVEAEITVTVKS